ncbi:hypothetical protein N7G274_004581 [Stereocaulon virgatum]|uniref:Endopolyphosphatase n=1 Tax=Stereocaulon virgatum TaxID=373712 RepID=A0ABR4ABJ0_9LECA
MFLRLLVFALSLSFGITIATSQKPLSLQYNTVETSKDGQDAAKGRALQGRFLHITDFHPDEFYEHYSSTGEEHACHRGDGPAGVYGAETTDCDSPTTLINATFRWINDNLKDTIDFVIWTGDSARHDSDERIPRTEMEVVNLNEMLVEKFVEIFGKQDNINDTDPTNDLTIPVVPTFGNNDIMPHNIFQPGPNWWTKKYASIWRKFIPEEQRHGFVRGGWFSVEVIPNHLAVLSLNTLYFFDSNTAVDGCAYKSEPGYEHMEWLRIQLQFLRQRGMKAILMGHVPPARTESKLSWDETCWQKYTLWMRQYRDVVVGSVYGHMNIDHFMLQDFEDISSKGLRGDEQPFARIALDDELTIQSSAEYLTELRADWSRIPEPPKEETRSQSGLGYFYDLCKIITRRSKQKKSRDKFLKKIGGEWGERYSLSLISPSVVPNYFPTMRVVEYNISGLDIQSSLGQTAPEAQSLEHPKEDCSTLEGECMDGGVEESKKSRKKRKGKKKSHKYKKPNFKIPKPPSKSAPPGPAYSSQTFSWLGYTQYYANLTRINNDFTNGTVTDDVGGEGWHDGKHKGKKPKKKSKKHHRDFKYEIEYDTRNETVFGLQDLSVRNYIDLAGRIGQYKPEKGDRLGDLVADATESFHGGTGAILDIEEDIERTGCAGDDFEASKKKHKKHKHRKMVNKVWFTFVDRAYVGTRDAKELRDEFE